MATERVVYEADTARLMSAIQQVVDKEVQLRGGIKKTKDAAKDTEDGFSRMGATAAGQLKNMVAGWASVTGAIGLARMAYSQWSQEMSQAAEKFTKFTTDMTQAVSGRGDLARLTQIREHLEKSGPPGVLMEEKIRAYSAVGGAMPTADWRRVLAVTDKAMEAKLAGADIAEFGTVMGELAKMMGETPMDDLADLSKIVTETTGRHGQKFGKAGMKVVEQWLALQLGSAEQGLAYALASFEAGQGGEGALSLVSKLAEQKQLKKMPLWKERRLPEEQQKERAFYGADAAGRLRMIREDPAARQAIFGSQAGAVEAMLSRDPGSIEAALAEAQRTNVFERSKELVQADAKAKLVQNKNILEAAVEQDRQDRTGQAAMTDDSIKAAMDLWLADMRPITRWSKKAQYNVGRFLGAEPRSALWWAGFDRDERDILMGADQVPQKFKERMEASTPAAPQQVFPNAQIINFTPGLIPHAQIRPPLAGDMGGNVYE